MSRQTPSDEPAANPDPDTVSPAKPARHNSRMLTGVAVGIGSAAIVAALLYANRSRHGD